MGASTQASTAQAMRSAIVSFKERKASASPMVTARVASCTDLSGSGVSLSRLSVLMPNSSDIRTTRSRSGMACPLSHFDTS